MRPCLSWTAATALAGAFACAPAAAQDAAGPAPAAVTQEQVGTVFPEQLFHPVYPCRVFNTATTSKAAAGAFATFQIAGDAGFPEQGGRRGGCGVPAYATMVSLNLSVFQPEGKGAAFVAATAEAPKVRTVSFAAGGPATGAVNAMLNQGKLVVQTTATTHLAADVTGYYAPQLWAVVRPEGSLYMTSGAFIAARRVSTGVYEVTADREIHICGAVASAAFQNYYAAALTDVPPKSYVTVKVFDAAGQPVDGYFTVRVMC